jgi:ribonuclease VapC
VIVVDTSAVVAIFRQESDAASYAQRIADDDQPLMSAANIVETSLVLRGLKRITSEQAERWLDEFLVAAGIHIEQVTTEHVQLARRAHIQFGKGTGHPANLNFGDCFAYALARAASEALLFKGDDFSQTDVIAALPR